MNIQTKWGIPVVYFDTVYPYLKSARIRPWPVLNPPVDLATYIAGPLTEAQQRELKYAPKAEMVTLQDRQGEPWHGFRTIMSNWRR